MVFKVVTTRNGKSEAGQPVLAIGDGDSGQGSRRWLCDPETSKDRNICGHSNLVGLTHHPSG